MNKIAILNDNLRKNIFNSGKDKVVLTQFVSHLPIDEQLKILIKVKDFNNFNEGNNPYGENDFGMIEHRELNYFFKIDYYDNDLKYHSPDPSDPTKTIRVLTVMHASEY